ncbi:hypothetical protein OE88DRAFT_1731383 [Heliocybe sulcata]|uniref:Uncharacterized protein n=1 Tax=Heliocybe sulcata TaxID=5364 RepID=A0A5C3ND06_9AGAM|nr:hypothetical protein OE88DRAFT_1731383 [Heliocybe sulcata]
MKRPLGPRGLAIAAASSGQGTPLIVRGHVTCVTMHAPEDRLLLYETATNPSWSSLAAMLDYLPYGYGFAARTFADERQDVVQDLAFGEALGTANSTPGTGIIR